MSIYRIRKLSRLRARQCSVCLNRRLQELANPPEQNPLSGDGVTSVAERRRAGLGAGARLMRKDDVTWETKHHRKKRRWLALSATTPHLPCK